MSLAWILLAACGSSGSKPDAAVIPDVAIDGVALDPVNLSNMAGGDEDPGLVRQYDGHVIVAWYSRRSGNGDIYLRRTLDGVAWDPAVQVTSSTDTDFYPNLIEGPGNLLYMVWHRVTGGVGHIEYNKTGNATSWNATTELAISSGGDDWSPSIAATSNNRLVVAFARNTCGQGGCFALEVVTSDDGGATWTQPASPGLTASGFADHLPMIVLTGDHVTMVWNRYVSSMQTPLPYMTATSEVMMSTSTDGVTWTPAVAVTQNSDYDLFPALYQDQAGTWMITWLTAKPPGMTTMTVEQAVTGTQPSGTIAVVAGYSPRVIATALAHRYLAAWVQGTSPELE